MKRSSCTMLLVAMLSCFLQVTSSSPVLNAGPRSYDIGCYKETSKVLSQFGFQAFTYNLLPSCTEGGLYKGLQCRRSKCYCAYVDTGLKIPNYHLNQYSSSYSEMESMCPNKTSTISDRCSSPHLQYPCKVAEPKFKYNPATKSCEKVAYGCYGHLTQLECEFSCVPKVYDQCSFPRNRGYYCTKGKLSLRWRHDPATGKCQAFLYRGCGGNSNNYGKKWQCEKQCVAEELVDFQVRVDMKIYNFTAATWVLDKYGLNASEINPVTEKQFTGLKEDANSYKFVKENVDDRSYITGGYGNKPKVPRNAVCFLPAKTGPCRALFYRWFYNPRKSQCEKFVYGGCLPNRNNFVTLGECENFCHPDKSPSEDEIDSPPKPGAGNINGKDPYLEQGATIVHRIGEVDDSGSTNPVSPRSLLLSDGPSGEVESSS